MTIKYTRESIQRGIELFNWASKLDGRVLVRRLLVGTAYNPHSSDGLIDDFHTYPTVEHLAVRYLIDEWEKCGLEVKVGKYVSSGRDPHLIVVHDAELDSVEQILLDVTDRKEFLRYRVLLLHRGDFSWFTELGQGQEQYRLNELICYGKL